jgi:hypothetical protein
MAAGLFAAERLGCRACTPPRATGHVSDQQVDLGGRLRAPGSSSSFSWVRRPADASGRLVIERAIHRAGKSDQLVEFLSGLCN